ncbi:hypothetical protein K505DRAFT_414386 [Melanomma pulvis-pyrius CBS 109.77]|uniref:F-box domain-containing protein n=1 Tax=Melanomma pulvis-pyrius CBS 109.77 TaxID=1314802 RepID=A0A6A6XPJ9_9PLEO|nr:hypothetical protein K505DRAFT_414386 [Melanomma pulvis-pyrius CBS 109.77]
MSLNFLLGGCFGWRPSKMPKADEGTTQVWLWTMKVIFIIPLGIAAFESRKVYNTVKGIPEILHPPYNEHVLLAHLLTYIGTMTIFTWLFISSTLLIFHWKAWKSPYILLMGLIDLGLAVTLGTGIVLQAAYLPSTSSGCSNANTWQIVGMNKSFFSVIADSSPPSSAENKCQWFVSAWSEAVVSLSFQMLIAYVGVFFDEREYSFLNPFRPLFYLILVVISPPFWIHTHVVPRLRFAYRYILKLCRITGVKPLKFDQPIPYTPRDKHIVVTNPKLQQFLTIEHVLLVLVDNLHYEDVINLSLTCKSVREAVFPHRDLNYRIPKLKKRVCNEDSKKPCLYCNKKICFDCKATRFFPGLPGRRHVELCQPYCAKCYYTHFSRHARGTKKPCKCNISDRALEFQQMCRTCANSEPTVLRDSRFKRYQQEARDIADGIFLPPGEKAKCGSCKLDLKSGARWWVCGKCKGECRDAIHPPFAKRRKPLDVEKAEKQEREFHELETSRWLKWMALFRNE